jgi:hypothetical protein
MAIGKSGSKYGNQRSNRVRIEQWKQEAKWSEAGDIFGKALTKALAASIQIQMQ